MQARARGQRPICVGILLSSRWDYFNHAPKVCIRPAEWRRRRYDFDFLRELHAVVVPGDDCLPVHLGELVLELLLARPALLWAYSVEGEKLYDGEAPLELAHWIRQLGAAVPWWTCKEAARVFSEAIAHAARGYVTEAETIERRSGLEASVQWQLEQYRHQDQVRELFSAPFRNEPDDDSA